MTEGEYYRFYKIVRETNHSDHIRAMADLLKQVYLFDENMTIKEFYELKLKFMQRYFNESIEKYNVESMKG